jgi:hypothetical protein
VSFSYDPDNPTSPKDLVRLAVSDTNPLDFIFHDGEINGLLTAAGGDADLAAARAARSIAMSATKQAIAYRVNGFDMDRRDVGRNYLALAEALEKRATQTPFEIESVLDQAVDDAGVDLSNYPDSPV